MLDVAALTSRYGRIPALVGVDLHVGAGELVYQFSQLVARLGGVGEAFRLLGDLAREVWSRIGLSLDAALARMVAAQANALPKPIKWFCIATLFRGENVQRGRLREFFQWNLDMLGVSSPEADAELIAVAATFLRELLHSDAQRKASAYMNFLCRPDAEKLSPYECGFEAYEDSRMKFDVRYYLVAILFILFDLEIAFLFPWAVVLGELGVWSVGFWSMMLFLAILTVGFIYEWKRGALDWE